MIKLTKTTHHFPDDGYLNIFIKELIQHKDVLPLQAGLSHSSYVSDSPINIVTLNNEETTEGVNIKAGIFYTGIIAGCSCADDPSPVDEVNEYCEILVKLNTKTGEADIQLL